MNGPQGTARMRATQLAFEQASDAMIAAHLDEECTDEVEDGEAFVATHHRSLVRARLNGRAHLAHFVWQIGTGAATIDKTQLGMCRSLCYQHLGWTPNGVDDEIRKAREAMEKQPPHKRPKLEAVG